MEINVHISRILPEQSGVSKSGNAWNIKSFVGETSGEHQKQLCFTVFNNKCDIPFVGDDCVVKFDVESRSFNDRNGVERWSTELRAYAVDVTARASAPVTSAPLFVPSSPVPQSPAPAASGDDLPF